MKAFTLETYNGPSGLRLSEQPVPDRADDEVLVAVEAVGVNFPDLLMTQGRYQLKPDLPFVPGCEFAGTVTETPASGELRVGDKVAGFTWSGAFAEVVSAPVRSVAPIPDGLSVVEAAATVVNYHTTLFALQRRAGLRAGERVLVLGAAGGIGTAAIQVAKGLGAFVIGGVASQQQVEIATRAGADEVLVLQEGFAKEVLGRVPDGRRIDVVVDPLGSWLFSEALRTLAPLGRLVVIGFAAGEIPTVAVNRLLLRNVSLVGAAFGAFLDLDHELMGQQSATLARLVRTGAIRPAIEAVYDFDELPVLLSRLDRGDIAGKAIVRLDR